MFYFSTYCFYCFCEGGVQCFTFQLIVRIVFVYWMWRAVFYFSTYCFNCFCLMVVVCSVLLLNLLFQLFLFNGGGEQCFTFQHIVSIVFCLMVVVSSVLLFNLLFQLLLFNEGGVQCFTFQLIVQIVFVYWMWQAVFYFSTYCFNCFCLMVVVCSVLLFNLLFHLFLFNGGGEQCFTFQHIVSIVFV